MGQKIRKLLNSEKGSITVLVVAAMLFMIVILALSFMGMSNKTSTQMSNIKQIEAEYASEQDIEQVYKETIETIDRVGEIVLTPNTTEWTNQDITVTVDYQKQLTEKRMAGVGSANTPNATSVIVTENATVFAEAYTKEGFKRKASLQIRNIDKVKPTAVIRTNGGSYVMPSSGEKAKIKTRVNVSDLGGSELNDIKYAWSQSKDAEPTSWQTFADGDTLTKNDCTVGTYYLWLNVTDHAGSRADTKVSNAFIVRDSSNAMDNITFKVEPDGWTNKDVKVTVIYGDNLTENRKAGPEGGELKPNATTVIMTENGKVVAEAEDPAGNKVVAEITIDKIDKVPPVIKTVTNPSNGNWTNQNVTVTLVAEDNLSGIKEFQWFENGEWTTRHLTTSGNTGTIIYDVERDTTIRFRVIDNAGNISEEKTTVIKIDKTAPTHTRAEVKNITTTGYDVYVYGVTDGTGSGVNRVQFPTWTTANDQDDIQSKWETNSSATGIKQADGTTWVYHVNVTDHKNEYGEYRTHVYAYDNLGNKRQLIKFNDVQVPGVVITFNANGGTVTEGTRTKGYASQIGTLPTPTRTGYTFTGWFTAATGGTRITDTTTVPANNVTYYAQWTRDNYTISYNLNGGAISGQPTSYNVESNEITLPTPTKKGYTFTGWTGSNGTTPQTTVKIPKGSTGNKSYTANWTVTNYTITYNLNGGTITGNPGNYNIESNEITLPTPTKTGYTFTGWTGSNGTTPQTTVKIPKGSTENKTYTANWSINQYTLDLNMNVDGSTYGSGYNSRVTVGFKVGGVDQGYIQDYCTAKDYNTTWEIYGLKIDGQNVAYTASGKIGADRTVVWVNLNTVNFVANNSSYGTVSVANRLVVKGTNYTTSGATVTLAGGRTVTATKTDAAGYTTTFSNWTPASGTVNAATTVTANFTRTANKYTVAYNANGGTGTMATDTVTYDTNYTTKANAFTKTGYTFKGWNEKADGTGTDWTSWIGKPWKWTYTKNITLYAQWADTTPPTIEAYAGTMMFTDPSFASGNNSIRVYNNSSNGTVTHTRKAMSDNPAGSGYGIEIKTAGVASPGHGGFYFGHPTAANKEYIARIIAKIPTGYEIEWASNAYGTGGTITALTSKAGTGKWQEYLFRVKCGTTGTFNTTNYFYVKGGSTATASAPVVWQVGYATIFDTTAWGTSNYIIYTGADAGSGVVGYGVSANSTTEPTYTTCTATSKISSISDAKTANGKYYVWVKDAAGNKGKKEVSVNYVDRAAPTFTKVEVKNLSTTGYDVYIYGVTDSTGSGVNRVQFPSWTTANGQDDIQSNWVSNASATGVKQSDGTTWVYRVNVTDHKNEYGEYNTHIYLYDNLGNYKATSITKQNVPGVTITFNANGGTVTEGTRTKGYASQMGTLPTPTRTGYTFNGWYTAATGGTKIETTTQVPASNVIYYAHWTVNSYTVTYNFAENGGKSATKTSASVNYGSAIDLSPTAAKDGYTFVGWNTNKDATSKLNSLNMGTGNVTLYAIYSKTITGTFNYFDGTKAASKQVSQTVYNKTTQVTLTPPTVGDISGYTKRGWSTSNAANASVISGNPTLSSNTNYYMSYTYTVTATYRYNNTSTSPTATAYMNYKGDKVGGTPTKPANPTSSGWTFRGWSTNSGASAAVVTPGAITSNTTYYGSYSKTVTATKYVYNNSSSTATGTAYMNYANAVTNASINLGTTTLSGYTARGWSTGTGANAGISVALNGNASINANTTYYMSYTYTVTATYRYNNTSTSPTATAYMNYKGDKVGGTPAKPANPTSSGWTFRGWSTNSGASATVATPGAITANTTYYGSYSKTVTATKYVYNNSSSTATGTAYMNYANAVTNASINLGTTTLSGYTARGWSTGTGANAGISVALNGNASINANTTYYMSYTYTVTATYRYNNTSTSPTATAYMNYKGDKVGGTPAKPANPTSSGWTFRGWSTNSGASATVATPGAITANTTYYGSYSKTVTATKYVYNNSSSTATGTAYMNYANAVTNASINLGTTTLSGYTARGWSTGTGANAGISVALNGNASINANTTYYMSYTYTVTATYRYNNTSTSPTATAYMNYKGDKVGGTPAKPANPTSSGWTFRGWSTNSGASATVATPGAITANTTYYGSYSKTVTATKYVYNNSSSTATGTAYMNYANAVTNASINLGTTTPPSGYTARGWSTGTGANATVNVALNGNASINANATYYMSYSYGVTLTYNANSGTGAPAAQSGTAYMNYKGEKTGAAITLSTTKPTRTYYTFSGWYTATSGGTKLGTSYTITENKTIYAQWSGNVYTVTLNNQSATTAGSTAVYEKYGTGIYKESTCTNKMTTSANAISKPSRSYTLTYNANGGSVSPATTTASYTFGGYYTSTGGGGDQLINANGNITDKFTTTKYGANATLYAKWTATATTLATPTREGYTFKGWFTEASGGTQITSATSIKASQIIYAHWEEIAIIKVGDYINYKPDSTSQTTYSKNNLVENITGSTKNTADIIRGSLKWQVLKIHDDGSMDLIGSPTSQNIYFSTATGYNNGVYVMHDICEKLYSRNGIKARSVTLEDMENWLTDAGKTAKNNYISNQVSGLSASSYIEKVNTENNTVTYKKRYSYYPNLYAKENGSGINTETVKTDGIKDTNKAELDRTTIFTAEKSYKQADNLTTTQTYYYIPRNSTNYGDGSKALYNSTSHWVASRYVSCHSTYADFGLRYANGTYMCGDIMFSSGYGPNINGNRLRPVVSLGSDVQVTASSTASSSTGTPHTITQY